MGDLVRDHTLEHLCAPAQRPLSVADMPKASAEKLLARCRESIVHPGQMLFQQAAPHVCSYIIVEGLVRTYYTAENGREITLAYWSAGDLIGGPNFLGGGYHVWSARVVHGGRVLAVNDRDLRKLAEEEPEILRWVADTLSFKLRWLSILFQIHGTESVRRRVAKLLVLLSQIYGESDECGITIKHRISQSDLATLAGASRQWTNRMLSQFKRAGLLEGANRRIRILDLKGLDAISSEEARPYP